MLRHLLAFFHSHTRAGAGVVLGKCDEVCEMNCPECITEKILTEFVLPAGSVLDPGDYVVCPQCAAIFIIDTDLSLRAPNVHEWSAVLADPPLLIRIKRAQLAICREIFERRGGKIIAGRGTVTGIT